MKKEKSWGATGFPLPPEKRDSVSRPCQQGETRLLSVTESSHSEKWEIGFRLGLFSFLCDVLWLCWENVSPVQFLLSSPSSQFWGAEGAPSPWETGPALARSSPGPQEGQRWHPVDLAVASRISLRPSSATPIYRHTLVFSSRLVFTLWIFRRCFKIARPYCIPPKLPNHDCEVHPTNAEDTSRVPFVSLSGSEVVSSMLIIKRGSAVPTQGL